MCIEATPPLPGITHPSHLLPSAHALPKPRSGDLPIIDDCKHSSDSEFGNAEVGGRLAMREAVTGVLARARAPGLTFRKLHIRLCGSAGPDFYCNVLM